MSTLFGVLAILSASAAAGMRIALPLLAVGLLHDDLWAQVPILSRVHPQVVIAVLTSWSLLEFIASKHLLGQRILQIIQLIFTPLVGAMLAMTVAKLLDLQFMPLIFSGLMGGSFALVLRLVMMGWFLRLRGIPLWIALLEDLLCVGLVFFAFRAPQNGGIIAMFLLWIALRSSTAWRKWFQEKNRVKHSDPH